LLKSVPAVLVFGFGGVPLQLCRAFCLAALRHLRFNSEDRHSVSSSFLRQAKRSVFFSESGNLAATH
jgi:hypothetical protein